MLSWGWSLWAPSNLPLCIGPVAKIEQHSSIHSWQRKFQTNFHSGHLSYHSAMEQSIVFATPITLWATTSWETGTRRWRARKKDPADHSPKPELSPWPRLSRHLREKFDRGYDFFSQKINERRKCMHRDTFNVSLIAERIRRIKEQSSWGRVPQLDSTSTLLRKKSFLSPFLSFPPQSEAARKEGPQLLETGRERELQCLSTLLPFLPKGPLLSSSSHH